MATRKPTLSGLDRAIACVAALGVATGGCELFAGLDDELRPLTSTAAAGGGGAGGAAAGGTGGGHGGAGGAVDTQTDPHNCGAIGHDCLGGDCSLGVCRPFALVDATDRPYAIALFGGFVYWGSSVGIERVRIDGSERALVHADGGYVRDIAVDDAGVYYLGGGPEYYQGPGRVVVVPSQGDPISLEQPNAFSQIAVDATHVYWTALALDAADEGQVRRASRLDLAGAEVFATNPGSSGPRGLALEGGDVYWHAHEDVARLAKSSPGGPYEVVASTGSNALYHFAVDAAGVYWSDELTGAVATYRLPDGPWENLDISLPRIRSVDADATHVYASVDAFDDGRILRFAKTGAAPAEVVASGQPCTTLEPVDITWGCQVAVGATAVYWTTNRGDRLMKLAK